MFKMAPLVSGGGQDEMQAAALGPPSLKYSVPLRLHPRASQSSPGPVLYCAFFPQGQ